MQHDNIVIRVHAHVLVQFEQSLSNSGHFTTYLETGLDTPSHILLNSTHFLMKFTVVYRFPRQLTRIETRRFRLKFLKGQLKSVTK